MESKDQSSVNINLKEGVITVSGTEAFVERILSTYMSRVQQYKADAILKPHLPKTEDTSVQSLGNEPEYSNQSSTEDMTKYIKHGIYHYSNGETTLILPHLPGKNNSAKMQELLLLMGFAAKDHKINTSDFKILAQRHSCLDSNNFASILKRNSNLFLRKGQGKTQQIELTFPGIEEAKKLLDSLTTKNEKSN